MPFALTQTNKPIHWALSPGCIPTSYSADLAPQAALLTAAVKAVNDIDCATLCLDPPQQRDDEPDLKRAERRIHFQLGPVSGDDTVFTTVYYEVTTGRILIATANIASADVAKMLTAGDVLHLLGSAVGLEKVADGVDSVMADSSSASALTTADREALCTLYGTSSYCGD